MATVEKNGTRATSRIGAVSTGSSEPLVLQRLRRDTIHIPIEGMTPVIPHKWSEKALRMMLDKQQGRPVNKKEPKDPETEAHASMYWLEDGVTPGMPAVAFKAAIADAADAFENVTIKAMKKYVFVVGEGPEQLVPLEGEMQMREDTPRLAGPGRTADLRYRFQVYPWRATLIITYAANILTAESLLALVDAAGFGGVGDWRPSSPQSKSGTFGQWQVTGEIL